MDIETKSYMHDVLSSSIYTIANMIGNVAGDDNNTIEILYQLTKANKQLLGIIKTIDDDNIDIILIYNELHPCIWSISEAIKHLRDEKMIGQLKEVSTNLNELMQKLAPKDEHKMIM